MRLQSQLSVSLTMVALGLAACGDSSTAPSTDLSSIRTATRYRVQALKIPPTAFLGEASAINDSGIAAGWYRTADGWTAVIWTTAKDSRNLGKLPGLVSALAKDINQAGTVVGFALSADLITSHAFVWTDASGIQPLPDLGGGASLAQSINGSGAAVGWAADPFGVTHAVMWSSAGVLTDLNPSGGTSMALDVNDAGDAVGWVFPPGSRGPHAHLWRHDGVQKDLGTLGGVTSVAISVNNALEIVGFADPPLPRLPVGFVWTPTAGMRPLGFGENSEGLAISEAGRAVGLQVRNDVVGYTWRGEPAILPDLAPAKGHFSGPTGVNRCGTIVGSSLDPSPINFNPIPAIWKKPNCDSPD
jgi:probable HAF family extracellular repeat protein